MCICDDVFLFLFLRMNISNYSSGYSQKKKKKKITRGPEGQEKLKGCKDNSGPFFCQRHLSIFVRMLAAKPDVILKWFPFHFQDTLTVLLGFMKETKA